ncbi:flagellar basal body L-ring protein FlgH [Desulfohalovibrio reitneri]|uniref:flagellar basal body L-ring protein FlgH n=1 Tax=Desulfohalovibrio reitneri TaxID=1307759 RepID=UPI0004A6F767|nr:flagellar basal body L-ring protein FlgH [Desulfohalovibrio reitneri]
MHILPRTILSLVLAAVVAAPALLSGCAPADTSPEPSPVLTPPPGEPTRQDENPGSLFGTGQAENLFADNRARRLGDIVTVKVVETSEGTHEAETDADRASNLNLQVQSFFNKGNVRATPFGIPSFGLNGAPGDDPLAEVQSNSEFSATGETTRESELTATLGARVVDVLPSGMLQIEGAREMRINDETQVLIVRGLVRPQDIASDNSITSDKIADAKIQYFGQGVLADKQKPGWMIRVLDNIWPF